VEEKEAIKKRLLRSPDDGDAYVMALEVTPKRAQAYKAMVVPDFGAV
jgi:hypothetical protein